MAAPKTTHKPRLAALTEIASASRERGLTERQEKFCQIYAIENVGQSEAARRAGYANNSAGSLLLNEKKFPAVSARIRELKRELSEKYEVTFDNHVRKLAEIRDMALADKKYPAAVAAEKARGQAAGLYINRSEILVGKIDQMGRDEVLSEINRMMREFPMLAGATAPSSSASRIIDVTPEAALPELSFFDEDGGLDIEGAERALSEADEDAELEAMAADEESDD